MFFSVKNLMYIAVIGDIINSKEINDRGSVQKKLASVLNDINIDYKEDIASKFMITLGDEFQGLLHRGSNLIKIIEEIEYRMYPVKIRFGIGVGSITTDINYEMPLGADGPAYYYAREMIEDIKSFRDKPEECDFKIKSESNETDLLFNTISLLLSSMKRKWTDRQRDIVHSSYYFTAKQKKIAEMFGVTQATVQKILKNADYRQYKIAMDNLAKVLGEIGV